MDTLCIKFLIIVSILLLTGCNDEIFVGEVASPSKSQLDIPAGGEATFTFPTEYLDWIDVILPETGREEAFRPSGWLWNELDEPYPVYMENDYDFIIERYDAAGNVEVENVGYDSYANFYNVWGETPKHVRSMKLSNFMAEFEVGWDGSGKMTVKAIKNLTGHAIEGRIALGYSFKSESVGFTLAPSLTADDRYEVLGIRYDKEERIRTLYTQDSISVDLDNPGTDTVVRRVPIAGYCRAYIDYSINPKPKIEFDASKGFPDVEIPTYRDLPEGGMVAAQLWGEKVPFSLHETVDVAGFDSALWEGASFDRAYVISLPPHTGFRGVLEIRRLDIATIASLRIRNTVNGGEMEIPVKVRVNQPWSYGIKYKKISLDEQI